MKKFEYECQPSQYENEIKTVLEENSGEVVDGDYYYEFDPEDQESFFFI